MLLNKKEENAKIIAKAAAEKFSTNCEIALMDFIRNCKMCGWFIAFRFKIYWKFCIRRWKFCELLIFLLSWKCPCCNSWASWTLGSLLRAWASSYPLSEPAVIETCRRDFDWVQEFRTCTVITSYVKTALPFVSALEEDHYTERCTRPLTPTSTAPTSRSSPPSM